ncbi:MAG TPA: glycosyltransferase [Candidatus Woesebacteria bacterium]|mgnify:CR=1 FL=1|nr:glycosyltransferase [Candidatus Woesebacteria bacterium]HRT39934.1 glycosyltransferase [Candidatus Woesebacteria bacterium]
MDYNAVSVVIPCYNEEENLKRGVLDQVDNFLKKQTFQWEVIIANDHSSDQSLKLIQNFIKNHDKFRVLDLPHGGKPSAVYAGIKAAKYNFALFTDMDQSTPISELIKLMPYLRDFDLIIGSRGTTRSGNNLLRRLGARIFLTLRRWIILPEINDTQCGFKIIRTDLAKKIFPRLSFFQENIKGGWRVSAFDVEMLFMAQKWGYKIKEVPVLWQNQDISQTKGNRTNNYFKESIQMVKEIWQVRKNDYHGKYEKK